MKIHSDKVRYTDDAIFSEYTYTNTAVEVNANGDVSVTPTEKKYDFKTHTKVAKVGCLLVGWGGNNGSTVTGATIANRENMSWRTKEGTMEPNYFGSLTQASTIRVGSDANGRDVHVPLGKMLPMANPNDIVYGGWDISRMNLADAMERAGVFDVALQDKLRPQMEKLVPMPAIYYPDFIAANQSARADNVLKGSKAENLEEIRKNIRDFKKANNLDKVVVLWTANTERFADIVQGVNDTKENLMDAINEGEDEVSPSTVYAVASILEGAPFINGSPQNTFVPGVLDLAESKRVFVGGDDFKSGQTKMKSVLVDFLVGAGLKPTSIASYNHLGNNDGKNLSSAKQFRSKEISKSNVVDDMVASNPILYKEGEHPDHIVVIKYLPEVGDSKRALDEYTCDIFMGGKQTISMYNVCEDSLLASPLIIDLVVLVELFTRIEYKTGSMDDYAQFHSILSVLSYLLKAPLVPAKTPVVNALFKQRSCIENIMRACLGIAPDNHMLLEHKCFH